MKKRIFLFGIRLFIIIVGIVLILWIFLKIGDGKNHDIAVVVIYQNGVPIDTIFNGDHRGYKYNVDSVMYKTETLHVK